jgi:Asp-tRNA(Asn)/Glu-tRNA(Gln) amidotransferase A subunit family amidase
MRGVEGIASAVRSGEVLATELVAEHLEQIDRSPLNAFTSIDAQGAMAAAQKVDARVQHGEDPGRLAGVPLAVKDLINQAGLVNTAGSSFYRETPDETAVALRRLEQQGAIPIGRTGLHEFAFGFSSENHWFGPVRNPWNTNTSPGGSSGGSGAAVAAGLVAAALGTDTGGSVRVPAALCGVVGLKVTHGRIPISGVFPLAPSLDTVGPISRSVSDAAALYELMAGGDESDPWSAFSEPTSIGPPSIPKGLRVGIPRGWIEEAPMTDEVSSAFEWITRTLRESGVDIQTADLPEVGDSDHLLASAYGEIAVVHREFRTAGREYGPEVERRMARADTISVDEYVAGLEWRARLRQSAERAFKGVDLIITPATCTTTKVIGEDLVDTVQGQVHYRSALSWFSAPINHAGLPALTLPLAVAGNPAPALQVIAPWWREHTLLEFGLFLEGAGLSEVTTPPDAD